MSAVSDRVARGRAKYRTRFIAYAALGGYAAAMLLGTAAGGNTGAIGIAVLAFGSVVFWLGRRSALESASAEAHAWAVATASAQATSTALAGVQVNFDMGSGRAMLTDATGLHQRIVEVGHPVAELDAAPVQTLGAFPIASSNPARGLPVNPPSSQRFVHEARSASHDHMVSRGVDGLADADSVAARDGAPHSLQGWPFTTDDRPRDGEHVR